MSLNHALMRYGIRFGATSYTLRVDSTTGPEDLTFPASGSLDVNADYFMSGDGSSTDLLQLLEDFILQHSNVATCSVTLDSSWRVQVTGTLTAGIGFQLLFNHANSDLDGTIWGWDGDSDTGLPVTSDTIPQGILRFEQPLVDDSRPRQPRIGGIAMAMSGASRTSDFGKPKKVRTLSAGLIHRSKALIEYAEPTGPDPHGYSTVEWAYDRSQAYGYSFRYHADENDSAGFGTYKLAPPRRDPLDREEGDRPRQALYWQGRWDLIQQTAPPSFTNAYSLLFDGSSGNYVDCTTITTMDGSTAVTISAWIRPESFSTRQVILGSPDVSTTLIGMETRASGALRFFVSIAAGSTAFYECNAGTLTAGQVHHLALVFDGGLVDTARLVGYVDGNIPAGSYTFTPPASVRPAQGAFVIGTTPGNVASNLFDGYVDEVSIWSTKALSAAEVSQVYNAGAPSNLNALTFAGPTHWWRMGDGDTYPTISDVGSDGTATGTMTSMAPGDIVAGVFA